LLLSTSILGARAGEQFNHLAKQVQRLPQARRIPLSRRSHIIGFQALPNGTASHESALERDFVTLTSFSDPAAIIRSQPVTIAFDDEGFRRRYTPDFLVTCETSAELVEVKYEHDLKTQWKRLHPAFRAAEHWASTHHGVTWHGGAANRSPDDPSAPMTRFCCGSVPLPEVWHRPRTYQC
jgi:hypothetical protein